MRRIFVLLHRWFGLFTAVFLFIAGTTGAIIAWEHELDELLNPQLSHAQSGAAAKPLPALELARRIEAGEPRLSVSYLELASEPGHTLKMFVAPRLNAESGEAYQLGYDELAVDPATATIQGQRNGQALSLTRENLMPFLVRLHHSLHLPEVAELELGYVFMGIVAIVWTLDAFIALWLAFPSRKTWRKSLLFRVREGGHKLKFDLHRSGGVWAWLLMLTLSVSAVSMNLEEQVMRPLVSLFSPVAEDPFETREALENLPHRPTLSREQALALAQTEAAQRGVLAPAGGMFYSPHANLYGVGFFEPGNSHGDGGLGNPWLYIDAQDGKLAGADLPGVGSAGDLFLQAQFPLHSGRLFGITGRIIISLLGLVIAMLSVTGIMLWARKRRVRLQIAGARAARPASTLPQRPRPDGLLDPTPATGTKQTTSYGPLSDA